MGQWVIWVPEAATNKVLNPSAETTGNFAAFAAATVTQDTAQARFGDYAYKIVPGGVSRGVSLTLSALANAIHYFTCYVWGNTGVMQAQINGATTHQLAIIGGSTGGWVRYGFQFSAAECNASVTVSLINPNNETWWADGAQVEAQTYFTTYVDGDQGPLYRWTGLRHASTSTRDAQDRSGGRERDLLNDYGLKVRQNPGAGMPDIRNNLQPLSTQPGALFQSGKVQPRSMALVFELFSTSAALTGTHSLRKKLINLIKSDAVRGNQAFVLGYTAASGGQRTLYGQFRYAAGLGIGSLAAGPTYIEQDGGTVVPMIAVDPFWYEDSIDTTGLAFTTSLSADFGFGRIAGLWSRFGSGFNGKVQCVAVDYLHNRIFFGGQFTTANGVTVNGICYWDGITFQPLGGATKGVTATANVYSIAISPNGDIWAGGDFPAANGGATKGLAKWAYANPQSANATVFPTSTTFQQIFSICIDTNYVVYIGGTFTGFNGVTNASHIAKTVDRGTTWAALTATVATGGSPAVHAIVTDLIGTSIYFSGDFTAIGGVAGTSNIAKYDGTNITALATGTNISGGLRSLSLLPSNILYVGGQNYFAAWNGTAFSTVSTAYSIGINGLAYDGHGLIYIMTTIGNSFYVYNGSAVNQADEFFGTNGSCVGAHRINGDIYTGMANSTTPTGATITTVTITSTAAVFPTITIIGTTTIGSQTQIVWIENQSNGQRLFLNFLLNGGETATIDLRFGRKIISTDWRGVVLNQPISGSDFAAWQLMPGSNAISAFLSGVTTGAAMLVHSQPRHWAVDMVAP